MTVLAPRPVPAQTGDPWPKADVVTTLPVLLVEVHSRCNCRCVMCDIWKGDGTSKTKELSLGEAASWTADLRALGVGRVVLTGGEPLLHSDPAGLARVFREAGAAVGLLTTGLALARHAPSLAGLVDDVVVSLDGPRAVHDEIRAVPRAFERLAEGVRAWKAASPGAGISGRCTVQRRNASRLRDTVAAAREIGLDRISFLPSDVFSEAFGRPAGWSDARRDDVAPDFEGVAALDLEIAALARENASDLESGFVAEDEAKLRARVLEPLRARAGLVPFRAPACNAPWVSGVVTLEGTLRPCFFHRPVGAVRTAGLAAALNGPAAVSFRRELDVETNETCRRCVCSLNLRRPPLPS